MPQNPISDNKLLEKDDYKSIMYLLEHYQYRNYKKVGLTAAHFLYALKKRSNRNPYNKKMEEFFTNYSFLGNKKITLDDISKNKRHLHLKKGYIEEKKIVPGCIKNSVQLNDRLRTLKNRGWIKTSGKPKYYRYFTTVKWVTDKSKRSVNYKLEKWDADSIIDKMLFDILLDNDNFLKHKIDEPIFNFVLCGFPYKVLEKLNEKEKKELNQIVYNSTKNLYELIKFKYKIMKISPKKRNKLNFDEINNLESVGFHFSAYMGMVDRVKLLKLVDK